jgi:hypothetical protein
MSSADKPVRQSISLPAHVARRVKKKRFFEFADRLSRSRDPDEQKRLKEELARITFGD